MDGPVNLTGPGDVEELAEMIGNEGSTGISQVTRRRGSVGRQWPTLPFLSPCRIEAGYQFIES
jgi:hypothetical protein